MGSFFITYLKVCHAALLSIGAALYSACLRSYSSGITSIQSLSCVQLFATPWNAAHEASLSITNSRSLLKLMSIELVMPSKRLILCCPLILLP